MDADKLAKQKQKQRAAGIKAALTKGPEGRSRTAKMANWTRKHGKNDAENPHSKANYYPHGWKPENK